VGGCGNHLGVIHKFQLWHRKNLPAQWFGVAKKMKYAPDYFPNKERDERPNYISCSLENTKTADV
jgi:hypothetical protein